MICVWQTMNRLSCDVLVVGAGPVGLVAGIDLARRGVDVVVVDRRVNFDPLTVRCNHISAQNHGDLPTVGACR